MKKILSAAVLLLASLSVAFAQTGTWSGDVEIQGMKLGIVFHFEEENPTMDVPDQGAKGLPIQLTRPEEGKVSVKIPSIAASYEGQLQDGKIVGNFLQMGASLPLTLTPGLRKLNRPQTPVGPFPYAQEEVSIQNGDVVLSGTLVLPEGCTRQTPVLVMVSGSGLQNRDEELMEHRPFAVIADALARAGYATLRYDDRGFGGSTGDLVNVTTEDLKNDALAGVELLRKQFKRVGILGHSEGGTIGLMLAAEGKVDFVVSLAGGVVSFEKTLLDQNRWTLQQAGYSQDVTDRYCTALESLFDELKAGGNPEPTNHGLPAELEQNLQIAKAQSSTPYMRYFLGLDLTDRLGKITCPVLALNGTKDRQVNSEENLNALQNGLAGQKEIKAMEGLNHMFQHCNTGNPSEYKDIEETFAPEALEIIVTWIKKR